MQLLSLGPGSGLTGKKIELLLRMIPTCQWLSSVINNFHCDELCSSSLNGVLHTASRDEKPGALCWCNVAQDPYPCDMRKCASVHLMPGSVQAR
eukprot:scaffold208771_cov19-Tisochrysis_lutea.AAC.1